MVHGGDSQLAACGPSHALHNILSGSRCFDMPTVQISGWCRYLLSIDMKSFRDVQKQEFSTVIMGVAILFSVTEMLGDLLSCASDTKEGANNAA